MNVSKYRLGDKRFIAFIDENHIPVEPLANAFLYTIFFHSSIATKFRIANELKIILNYFKSKAINLEERISTGELLTEAEISNFYASMRMNKSALDQKDQIYSINTPDIYSKKIRNSISVSNHSSALVAIETCTGRVRTFRKYLSYIFDYFHGHSIPSQELLSSFSRIQARIQIKEKYTKESKSYKSMMLQESVIENDTYKQFKEVIQPHNPRNPFKKSKFRNYLILSILDQTGIRRSEVCKIKISDCQFFDSFDKIKIYSTPDDSSDPRLDRPNNKRGISHLVSINTSLMHEIYFYINSIRNLYPKAASHDFLFISEKNSKNSAGLPLSRNSVNYSLKKVSRLLNSKIHPHLLRHKWNERYTEYAAKKGLNKEWVEDSRRAAMGWVPGSNTGRIYNLKYEQLTAMRIMQEHQGEIDGFKSKE
ncbi:site-specific integrase [Pseudoalteromonas rhizosphaerae]|uniref:site-specific integrase n=1 Tax=Pseudoalteromonas rhizosphaerae TaxID=2518973 RepID=UPI001230D78F|nr:site-specific integrase [Pseudoalteromonas rhizosphaerae]